MVDYSVEIRGLDELEAALRSAPKVVQEELLSATTEADQLLLREVLERMKSYDFPFQELPKSVFAAQEVGEFGVQGLVGTPYSYAVPVELGTKPHFMGRRGITALTDWVVSRFGISDEKQATRAAFAIAMKISKRGTKGKFMFRDTFLEQQGQVQTIFARAGKRIAERLVNG